MPAFEPKPLKYRSLPGLSETQLSEHYKLYVGYVNKTNEIREKLLRADRPQANATYSEYRELKLEETFSLNGIKLHELYFDNLGTAGGRPGEETAYYLRRSFGSLENWRQDFYALGLAARGWGILAFDPYEREVRHFLQDAHNAGVITHTVPLLVLDVYEHAYFIDYRTDRKSYLNTFLRNINWKTVNERLLRCLKMTGA